MIFFRQSTASQEFLIGPFIDAAGDPVTGLTIANTDIKFTKSGSTVLTSKNSGGATEISGGLYHSTADATDTNTAGSGRISVFPTGGLPWYSDFCVFSAEIYDALIVGTDLSIFGIFAFGTAQASSTTTLVLASATDIPNDYLNGMTAVLTSGTGAGQSRLIDDYVNSSDTATVGTWVAPDTTTKYKVFMSPPASTVNLPDVNVAKAGGQTVNAAGAVTLPGTVASATNITAGTITTVTNLTNAATSGDFTATMKTSIGTAVAASAVASVTGNIGGNLGGTLTTTERNAIAAALLDLTNGIETGLTLRNLCRLGGAALAGKVSGGGTTTIVFRNAIADSKDRITATVDTSGNRSAITVDLT